MKTHRQVLTQYVPARLKDGTLGEVYDNGLWTFFIPAGRGMSVRVWPGDYEVLESSEDLGATPAVAAVPPGPAHGAPGSSEPSDTPPISGEAS